MIGVHAYEMQVDSQLIVDLDIFYQQCPEARPPLGLYEPAEGDVREVEEYMPLPCYCSDANCKFYDQLSLIYDDRKVDKLETRQFTRDNPALFRFQGSYVSIMIQQTYR